MTFLLSDSIEHSSEYGYCKVVLDFLFMIYVFALP